MLRRIRNMDKFVPALLLVIVIASIIPEPAQPRGLLSLHTVGDIGITLIFFFYGLKLNLGSLKQDLGNWHLHILVQGAVFILFPLLVYPFYKVFHEGPFSLLWLGAFFLAALPSTVSSSVVMVSIARGNIPGAIFNASVSSMAGIFFTPMWMGLVGSYGSAGASEFGPVVLKLILQVLVPVLVGLSLNRYFGRWAQRRMRFLRLFDQSIILLTVYLCFAESFMNKLFSGTGVPEIIMMVLLSGILFFIVYGIVYFIAGRLHFSREDKITAVFCGSKKSLIHGTVMAAIIFKDMGGVGVILLPLMVYHALQLVLSGIIANKFAVTAK